MMAIVLYIFALASHQGPQKTTESSQDADIERKYDL